LVSGSLNESHHPLAAMPPGSFVRVFTSADGQVTRPGVAVTKGD